MQSEAIGYTPKLRFDVIREEEYTLTEKGPDDHDISLRVRDTGHHLHFINLAWFPEKPITQEPRQTNVNIKQLKVLLSLLKARDEK